MFLRRTLQTVLVAVILVGTIIATLSAADLWQAPANRCPWNKLLILGCLLSTQKELAGGLIAGAGTIFAAWVAWVAVRGQIASDRALATARERKALSAILTEMAELIEAFNEVWRAIDYALLGKQPADVQANRIDIVQAILPALPPRSSINKLKKLTTQMARDIDPAKRGQFLRMLQSIDWIYGAKERAETPEDRDDPRHLLYNIRIHLSHFERYLSQLDAATAQAFADRQKSPVDHRGIGAHIRPIVDKAERGEAP